MTSLVKQIAKGASILFLSACATGQPGTYYYYRAPAGRIPDFNETYNQISNSIAPQQSGPRLQQSCFRTAMGMNCYNWQ